MSELVKKKPPEEREKFIAELSKVADEFDAVYGRYSDKCRVTGDEFSCLMKSLIFPSLLRLYREIDKLREAET